MRPMLDRRGLLGAAGLFALPRPAPAEEAFAPGRPIRIVVPYPPGGVTDVAGRVVADGFRDGRGWAAVVDNKPGASGRIGMAEVNRQRPDGQSLLIGGLGSHVIPPAVMPGFPFDVPRDFTALAKIAEFVNVLVVNPALPVRNVQDLVALAKSRPGELNFGSSGAGASNHLTAELFALETGTRFTHIPGQGANSSIMLLRAGDLHFIFENLPSVLGQIRDGALRPLAVTSAYRSRALPDLPTLAEAGYPRIDVASWIALYGPPGMAPGISASIAGAAVAAAESEAGRQRLIQAGFEIRPLQGAEFARFQEAELARWRDVVARAGVTVSG